MKKITIAFSLVVLLASQSCTKKDGVNQDLSFLNSATIANSNKIFDITTDNSGSVKITPTSEGAVSYTISFGHGTGAAASATVTPGNGATHIYPEGTYTVTIVSKSLSGVTETKTYPLTVTFRAPENLTMQPTVEGRTLKLKASALYAANYTVFWGDVANEVGTAMATGAELSHVYPAPGPYNVKVVANSGGLAKTEKTTAIDIKENLGMPITFEATNVVYFFGTFGTGQTWGQVANPLQAGLNTSAQVGQFRRGNEGWSGTYTPMQTAIDMTNGKVFRILVYTTDATLIGKNLNLELETGALSSGTISNGIAVLKQPILAVGVWQELVFNFGTIAGVGNTTKFGQLVLRLNDGVENQNPTVFVDNFRQSIN
jgi:hypothetical protein